jgi:hypothetical protein
MQARAEMSVAAKGVDGSYEQLVTGYATSLATMRKQINDLTAQMSLPFLPTVTGLQNSITQLSERFKSFLQSHEKILEGMAPSLMLGAAGAGLLALRSTMLRSLMMGGAGYALAGPLGGMLGFMGARGAAGAAGAAAGTAAGGIGTVLGMPLVLAGVASAGVLALAKWTETKKIIEELFGLKPPAWLDKLGSLTESGFKKIAEAFNAPGAKMAQDAADRAAGIKAPFVAPSMGEYLARHSGRRVGSVVGAENVDRGLLPQFDVESVKKAMGLGETAEAIHQQWMQAGEQAGQGFAQKALDAIRSILGGATVPGPTIAPPVIPQSYHAPAAAPAASEGKRADAGSQVHVAGINIHVHGSGDPHAVAHAVNEHVRRSIEAALYDGHAVMPA